MIDSFRFVVMSVCIEVPHLCEAYRVMLKSIWRVPVEAARGDTKSAAARTGTDQRYCRGGEVGG